MYSFLPDHYNKVLSQIDPQIGLMELDFSDEDHYRYFLSQVGGIDKFSQKYPHLVSVLHELRTKPRLTRTTKVTEEGYREGPQDYMAIENLIFQPKSSLGSEELNADSPEGNAMAVIMADYVNTKDTIAVSAELYDVTNEMMLHSIAEAVDNTHQFIGTIRADYPQYFQDTPREFMIHSMFQCTTKAKDDFDVAQLRAFVTKTVGFTLQGNSEIVKSFKLNAPVIQESHRSDPNHTEVKISYIREGAIPDYDYTNDDQPFLDGDNKRILVRVPFSVTVEAADKWSIIGMNEEFGYRMWLKNMVNGTINHYCNFDDIIQRKDAFDDQNRCTKMTFIFPESWNNILDFTAVGYKAYTDVDFYSGFSVVMSNGKLNMSLGVSVKSDGKDYDNLNIQSAKIFIQWGCVARDTEIMMADGEQRRADQIQIGDLVRNGDGGSAEVKKVLTGHEAKLYKISTPHRSIRMTPDHTVCTEQGLLPAIDLSVGMKIRTVEGLESVVAVEWTNYEDKVYNFELAEETILIGNGLLIGDSMLQNRIKGLVAYED